MTVTTEPMTLFSVQPPQTVDLELAYGRQTVTLGVLDSNAVYAYSNGQCHALAMALHELTGWSLAEYDLDTGDWCDHPNHWAVLTPSGSRLDIKGISPNPDKWGPAEPSSEDRWLECLDCCYAQPDMGTARLFAQLVLSTYGAR